MRFIYFLVIICFFLPDLQICQAQSEKEISPVEIGQKVPAHLLTSLPRQKNARMLILDFWNISCGACIAAFPEMDSLQKVFGDSIEIICVTRDSQAEVDAFEKVMKSRHLKLKWTHLRYITDDKDLSKCFPYQMVPHHVWLDYSGMVKAITNGYNTNFKNIESFLSGNMPAVAEKKDLLNFDFDRPFFANDDLPVGQVVHYSIFIKGNLPLTSGNRFRVSDDGVVYGRLMNNKSILELYKVAAMGLMPDFSNKKLILEAVDSSFLFDDFSNLDAWKEKNFYSYDLIVPPSKADSLYHYMLDDLNRYSGYYGRVEYRNTPCLTIVRKGNGDRLMTKGGEPENHLFFPNDRYLRNEPVKVLVAELNNNTPNMKMLVVDGTGYSGNIDIRLKGNFEDLNSLKKQLEECGLDLIEGRREMPMFILSRRNQNNE
jgi:thiol-disulfide isomerase/thioredoxin